MELKLALLCVVGIATSEAFLHHFLRRDQSEAQSAQSSGIVAWESLMFCFGQIVESCPQLITPVLSLPTGHVQNNHLGFSCSETTLRDNRKCVSDAVRDTVCENHRGGGDGMLLMWEGMCNLEQEFVENAACFRSPNLGEGYSSCVETSVPPKKSCREYGACFQTAVNSFQPVCTSEVADMIYGLIYNASLAMYGANC